MVVLIIIIAAVYGIAYLSGGWNGSWNKEAKIVVVLFVLSVGSFFLSKMFSGQGKAAFTGCLIMVWAFLSSWWPWKKKNN